MSSTPTQRMILYALGRFYESINQPLVEKPVQLRTSKIVFIELLLQQHLVGKQERAVYKNLEMLENKKMIDYEHKMIRFTEAGLRELTSSSGQALSPAGLTLATARARIPWLGQFFGVVSPLIFDILLRFL